MAETTTYQAPTLASLTTTKEVEVTGFYPVMEYANYAACLDDLQAMLTQTGTAITVSIPDYDDGAGNISKELVTLTGSSVILNGSVTTTTTTAGNSTAAHGGVASWDFPLNPASSGPVFGTLTLGAGDYRLEYDSQISGFGFTGTASGSLGIYARDSSGAAIGYGGGLTGSGVFVGTSLFFELTSISSRVTARMVQMFTLSADTAVTFGIEGFKNSDAATATVRAATGYFVLTKLG